MTSIDEAYALCRRIAHKHGANFSVGFRFLPKAKRQAVYAAYAYCRVADDIADEEDESSSPVFESSDESSSLRDVKPIDESSSRRVYESTSGRAPNATDEVAGISGASSSRRLEDSTTRRPGATTRTLQIAEKTQRLDEWQTELDSAYARRPTHPITIALADALTQFDIPKSAFVALIDGCRQDMVKTRYETFEELLQYCELVASSISDISLAIYGYRSDDAIGYGRSLATALQLTNVTRDIGDDLTRDRVYVPAEDLRRFGVAEQDLFAGVEDDRVRRLIAFQIERAEHYFREAEPLLRELEFDARFPTLLMGGVYATVLAKLRKDPLAAIRTRLSLSTLQKLLVVGTRVLRPRFI